MYSMLSRVMLARVLEAFGRAVHADDPRAEDFSEGDAAVANAAPEVDNRNRPQPIAELRAVDLDDSAPEDVRASMANKLRAIVRHARNQTLTFVVDDRLDACQL